MNTVKGSIQLSIVCGTNLHISIAVLKCCEGTGSLGRWSKGSPDNFVKQLKEFNPINLVCFSPVTAALGRGSGVIS